MRNEGAITVGQFSTISLKFIQNLKVQNTYKHCTYIAKANLLKIITKLGYNSSE